MDRATLIAAMQATANPKPKAVPHDQWGTCYVRPVLVAEVDEQTADEAGGSKARLARGACRVLCDEHGTRLFDPSNEEDVALLAAQPWAMLRKLLAAAEGREDQPGNVQAPAASS